MKKIIPLLSVLVISACAAPQGGSDSSTLSQVKDAVSSALSSLSPRKITVTSREVLGKDAAWLRLKLGEPSFIRADLQAHIWMYKNKACTLNLFLYQESDQNEALTILHFDARDSKGQNIDRDICLATF